MQYVRTISTSVSTAWNSINPATLSGAIDVIVVEQEDGSLSCSPFHVRFGKFSLLRPSDKKVEFKVNGVKQDYSMKLGEGGEAFFVFETTDKVPQSMQTSPLVSPVASPDVSPVSSPMLEPTASDLKEPDSFQLNEEPDRFRRSSSAGPPIPTLDDGGLKPLSSAEFPQGRPASGDWSDWSSPVLRTHSDEVLRHSARLTTRNDDSSSDEDSGEIDQAIASQRSQSPPPLSPKDAMDRANTLSRELASANIPSKVTETGDLMLDMSGFKNSEEDMIRAEVVARNILTKVLDGNYDIGSLFGFDTEGNLWIYSSDEARKAAMQRTMDSTLQHHSHGMSTDAVSDPGYHSDGSDISSPRMVPSHRRTESDAGPIDMETPPLTPRAATSPREAYRNYAKTLRLTSEQLKDLNLRPGPNVMSFTVNRATCSANMYLWRHEVPVVISDIDGTITKSDALGHVLNMIGRDWTHLGIAKLYSDISANGYNIMYLTSRSVGQADTTRTYLANIVQENFRMPAGPTILSPDRTMAALRREVYLRQPQVFKMATLRDIRNLYGPDRNPFYAGFGNRLTDQISYRTVDVPPRRIFTINSNSEVSLDLLTLNKKMSYVNINEVVDHYFPPVSTLVTGGGEQCTDFMYWRDEPLPLDDFSASDSDGSDDDPADDRGSQYAEYDDDDEEIEDGLADSYISRDSLGDELDRVGRLRANARPTSAQSLEDADDEEDEEDEDEDDEDDVDGDGDEGTYSEDDEEPAESRRQTMKTPHQRNAGEDVHAELITGIAEVTDNTREERPVLEEPISTRAPPISP